VKKKKPKMSTYIIIHLSVRIPTTYPTNPFHKINLPKRNPRERERREREKEEIISV